MKNAKWKVLNWLVAATLGVVLVACQKETETESTSEAEEGAIAVAATESVAGTSGTTEDSVYLMHQCRRGERRAVVAESSLPAAVGTYLTANYAGYTFHKALGVYDSNGTATAYIVVVYYNEKPVGLKFDASGNFVQVLEQREKSDLQGKGWHKGGRFQHRGGHRDSVAVAALPASVTAYLTANYAQDTLVKAFRSSDSGYVVISKNNGLFATNFSDNGSFVNRVQLPQKGERPNAVEVTTLPASITTYLESTYPAYVPDKAFALQQNGTVQGYLVLIDANNTRYGLLFDASGAFVKAKTIR